MFDKKVIKARDKKLEEARVYLKTQFIGIDKIIDKFINSVRIWYILPEIQSRPLVVNLWGITGVGKTDLVRKFVNFIDFSDRFAEIQLDSQDGHATIEDYLENTIDDSEGQGVLLLDEMQRFRTIADNGEEMQSGKYQDVWMLLSDGTFQSNSRIKQELIGMILESAYWEEREEDEDNQASEEALEALAEGDGKNKKKKKKKQKPKTFKYTLSHWEAARLKKILKLTDSLTDIMSLSKEDKLQLIKDKLKNKETYEGKKYSKLLIIISGNLDEAFSMANNVSDSDRDADVYHEFSTTIDIIKIKDALTNRFKPEQIARFGNTHLIYPIPNKKAYYSIIKQKVNDIITKIKDKHKISIIVDSSVHEVIYANGVFPTQGVRPLISTISSILENSLPIFLFEYLDQNIKKPINLYYEGGFLRSKIGTKEVKYLIPRVLDDIKGKKTINDKTVTSVHEAGHAIAYAKLFRTVPTQIVTNTTSQDNSGFVGAHSNLGSKQDLINSVIVAFCGRVAEELIFGKEYVTSGAVGDYQMATGEVCDIVRLYGMDKFVGFYQPPAVNKGEAKHDINVTDEIIEEILKNLYKEAENIIKTHKDFLVEISSILLEKDTISVDEFKKIASKYIGSIKIVNPKDSIEVDYNNKFNKFKTSLKRGNKNFSN